jgi:hypothetical protein
VRTLQQYPPFGHRNHPSPTDAPGALAITSASPAPSLPIRIEKDIGPKASTLFGSFLVAAFVTTLPGLFQRGALADVLFHSNSTLINAGLLVLAPLLYLWSRRRGELDISAQGIRVATKSGHWSYGWADIERAAEARTGVKLILKGRSDEQNLYNLIPNGFGLKPSLLCAIIADGINRFGADGPRSSIKTFAPADDLQAARTRSVMLLLKVYGVMFGGLFAAIIVWLTIDCVKELDLQKNGRPIEAAVTRIYTSGCGRSGCGLSVEYTFTPEPVRGGPRIEYRGYESIGSDRRPNDPDLIYARTNRIVPIVYDAIRPKISSLNFRNRIFERKPVSDMFHLLGIFGGILGVVALIFLGALTPAVVKARKATE